MTRSHVDLNLSSQDSSKGICNPGLDTGGGYWGHTSCQRYLTNSGSKNSLWTMRWTLNDKQHVILFPCMIVHAITKNGLDAKCQIVCPYFMTKYSKITWSRLCNLSFKSRISIIFWCEQEINLTTWWICMNTAALHHNIIAQHTQHARCTIINALQIS